MVNAIGLTLSYNLKKCTPDPDRRRRKGPKPGPKPSGVESNSSGPLERLDDVKRYPNKISGLTLVEVMVAIGLVAISLMLVLSLIPAGIHSAQRSEDIQTAAAWTRELLEGAPVPETFPIETAIASETFTKKLGQTNFTAVRKLFTKPGEKYLYHIEVETSWDDGIKPLKLGLTRYDPAGPLP